ncbi:zinc finger protein 184-like [Paramacrobiotus metropolitanus]|uniref:zinc finger protein 184-like n=1 Tax=Paramacrobiotus metropolitanus TaxID=2943436 RepID=UPI0024461B43|nr:zinc finger protein 184-like [Paramacrobiotus metropolitanus]
MELDSIDCCLPATDSESLIPDQDEPWQGLQNRRISPEGSRASCVRHRQERIFCAVCQQFLEEPCWLHAKSVPNESVVPFALASLPKILHRDVCADSSTGKKVVANARIPPHTVFGPLVAPLAERCSETYVYAFPSAEDGQLRFFQLDSELFSNWMRYVRFTENSAEKNLAVYLRGSQIVFVSVRNILPGEELKVCYSAIYSRTIGCANVQRVKQESGSFYVTGMEYDDHNENALPPTSPPTPMETGSHVDTFDWDGDSFGTQMIENNASDLGDVLISPHIRPGVSSTLRIFDGGESAPPPVNGCLASASAFAIPFPALHESADLRMDDDGSVSFLPACSNSGSLPIKANTMREGSPEIEFRPPFSKIQSPREDRSKTEPMTISRKSTLRSARKIMLAESDVDYCDQLVLANSDRVIDKPIRATKIVRMEPSHSNGTPKGNGDFESAETPEIADRQSSTFPARRKNPRKAKTECPVCHILVPKLRAHLSQEHPEYASEDFNHTCETCGMRYRSMFRLRRHISMMHAARGAEVTAELRQEAIEYMQKTGRLSFFCTACQKYFLNKSLLDIHELSHGVLNDSQARPERTCPACDFTGASFAELAVHTADHSIHAKERKQCLFCPQQVFTLPKHYKKNHPEYREIIAKDWLFECLQCRVKYLSQHHLDVHNMQAHNKYKCIYCALQFDTYAALGVHHQTHQKDGVFPCPMCPQTFPLFKLVRRHYEKSHDVRSVLVCDVCQCVCRNKIRWRIHMQSHNKDFRHVCTQCGKRFKAKLYLRNHIRRVHEGKHKESAKNKYSKRKEKEKQGFLEAYQDPRRKFSFQELPYKCHECKRGYVLRRSLVNHVIDKHPEVDPQSVLKTGSCMDIRTFVSILKKPIVDDERKCVSL